MHDQSCCVSVVFASIYSDLTINKCSCNLYKELVGLILANFSDLHCHACDQSCYLSGAVFITFLTLLFCNWAVFSQVYCICQIMHITVLYGLYSTLTKPIGIVWKVQSQWHIDLPMQSTIYFCMHNHSLEINKACGRTPG